MVVIEDHVMPMLMDAVVRVAAETSEENRSSVVESIIMQADDQKKKLQYCFGSKLYPNAVSMAHEAVWGGVGRSHY